MRYGFEGEVGRTDLLEDVEGRGKSGKGGEDEGQVGRKRELLTTVGEEGRDPKEMEQIPRSFIFNDRVSSYTSGQTLSFDLLSHKFTLLHQGSRKLLPGKLVPNSLPKPYYNTRYSYYERKPQI